MNSYLVIYQTDKDVSHLRKGLDSMRVVEHISAHSSIVLSFRSAEEIIDELNAFNAERIPVIVIKLDATIYTTQMRADFFEPNSSEHI